MKRVVLLLGVGVALVLIAVSCGERNKSGFKSEYRMQVNVGPTFYWGIGAAKFAELVKKKTDGRINVKPYYGSQLLKGAQLQSAQMVGNGAIDCAFESTINTAPVIPEMNVFCLPFFVKTFERVDKLEKGQTGKLLFAKMKEKGLMPLAWGENGFRQITNSQKAIGKPTDLKRLKIRITGGALFKDIFRALEADPINMNWGDAITAFQQGTVDGQENPVAILTAVQIWQNQKYVTMWNYAIDPLVLYWNKEEWDAFPDDIKKAIREAAAEACRFEKALVRAGLNDGKSLKVLKDEFKYDLKIKDPMAYMREKGMVVTEMSDNARKEFDSQMEPVMTEWTERLGKPLIEKARKDME